MKQITNIENLKFKAFFKWKLKSDFHQRSQPFFNSPLETIFKHINTEGKIVRSVYVCVWGEGGVLPFDEKTLKKP